MPCVTPNSSLLKMNKRANVSISWKPRRGTVRADEEGAAPMGTCAGMCSERERLERQRQKRLHRFEILPGTERDRLPSADPGRAVKEYSRPAAGKDSTCPSELRPPAVLLKTVCYLTDEIASGQTGAPWTEVYGFVFDRLRSARQDLTIQRVSGRPCVAVLERTLRFLVYASYRLCQEPLRCFDPKINDTHVQECFSWLLDCYQEGIHDNEPEVQALALLYNLGSLHALHHTLQLPEPVRSSAPVRLAASVSRAYLEGNLVRFFRLLRSLTFLQSCAVHRHLPRCRQEMLLFYSHGYSSRNCRYPLPLLAELLALAGPGEAAELCREHGITVSGDTVAFLKTAFRYPPALVSRHSYELVDRKQGDRNIAEVIHGYS
ncbi:SAC3 domain-containing protein 1-like [Huso huso]|uniref:SAC3 domain-containing protein 1-like n=1 Tax=Huso huso TaxID=61971 RepID=A0ABR0Y790_HUSHU